ncbi:NAD(P)H-dependent oxidoreductase [Pedobacter ginsengiterrae]|uniref:NAD(P)H-dependent oxidoreductase n=2 Tax=Pedobacter ginsengiterrae TaxID=871696 RepID=A0ABP7PG62_9SPHI
MFLTAIQTLEAQGHQVKKLDLYRMGFDPVSDRKNFSTVSNPDYFKQQLEELHATELHGFSELIDQQQVLLEWCELMIWQFPLWWYSVPAILKGWVDRVFAMGRVYGDGHFNETGKLKGKLALLSLTTGDREEAFLPHGSTGSLSGVLRPLQRGILAYTGFSVLRPHVVFAPVRLTDSQRANELEKWSKRLMSLAKENSIAVGSY